jgi:predicted phosphodiesterase
MKHLGTLKGPLLIFGGVFSNYQALREMKKIASLYDVAAQNVICTGDVVGYFPQPEECLQLIRQWGISCLAGEAEMLLRSRNCSPESFHKPSHWPVAAEQWYPFAIEQLSEESLQWVAELPLHLSFEYYGKKFVALYGSYHRLTDYIFKSTPWKVKEQSFRDTGADVILAGHSGLPFHHLKQGKIWLNPGLIGIPANDGTSKVWYLYLNFNEEWGETEFEHRSFHYDMEQTLDLVRRHQLSPSIVQTLKTGLWERSDFLPEVEAAMQGKELSFQ